jgi:hypothetical protein
VWWQYYHCARGDGTAECRGEAQAERID